MIEPMEKTRVIDVNIGLNFLGVRNQKSLL